MNFKFLLSFFLVFSAVSSSYASFPVKRVAATSITENIYESSNLSMESTDAEGELYSPAARKGDDKWVAAALWFVLGIFAAHRWYLGWSTGWNILYIVTLGGLGIWAIVDIVNILTDNY